MALIGYARVSSVGQSLDVQRDKLSHCEKVFEEKKSGASGKRPRLEACLEYVRAGDSLVITRLDRLARSTLHLCQIADELQRKGVYLQVIDQNIDTSNATGRLLFYNVASGRLRAGVKRPGVQQRPRMWYVSLGTPDGEIIGWVADGYDNNRYLHP